MKPWQRFALVLLNICLLAGGYLLLRSIGEKRQPEKMPEVAPVVVPVERPKAVPPKRTPQQPRPTPRHEPIAAPVDAPFEALQLDTETEFDDPEEIPEPPPRHPLRIWTAGKFARDARFLRYSNGRVVLKLESGEQVEVDAAKLSDEDRAWIEARR